MILDSWLGISGACAAAKGALLVAAANVLSLFSSEKLP